MKDSIYSRILNGIKNGIETPNGNRPFNLFDYYMITNMSLSYLASRARAIYRNEDNAQLVRDFANQNRSRDTDKNSKDILKINYQIGEYKFTSEEVKQLYNYMDEIGVPHYVYLFSLGLRMYLNGEFPFKPEIVKLDTKLKKTKKR